MVFDMVVDFANNLKSQCAYRLHSCAKLLLTTAPGLNKSALNTTDFTKSNIDEGIRY